MAPRASIQSSSVPRGSEDMTALMEHLAHRRLARECRSRPWLADNKTESKTKALPTPLRSALPLTKPGEYVSRPRLANRPAETKAASSLPRKSAAKAAASTPLPRLSLLPLPTPISSSSSSSLPRPSRRPRAAIPAPLPSPPLSPVKAPVALVEEKKAEKTATPLLAAALPSMAVETPLEKSARVLASTAKLDELAAKMDALLADFSASYRRPLRSLSPPADETSPFSLPTPPLSPCLPTTTDEASGVSHLADETSTLSLASSSSSSIPSSPPRLLTAADEASGVSYIADETSRQTSSTGPADASNAEKELSPFKAALAKARTSLDSIVDEPAPEPFIDIITPDPSPFGSPLVAPASLALPVAPLVLTASGRPLKGCLKTKSAFPSMEAADNVKKAVTFNKFANRRTTYRQTVWSIECEQREEFTNEDRKIGVIWATKRYPCRNVMARAEDDADEVPSESVLKVVERRRQRQGLPPLSVKDDPWLAVAGEDAPKQAAKPATDKKRRTSSSLSSTTTTTPPTVDLSRWMET